MLSNVIAAVYNAPRHSISADEYDHFLLQWEHITW
jgi:hypothetical protein